MKNGETGKSHFVISSHLLIRISFFIQISTFGFSFQNLF